MQKTLLQRAEALIRSYHNLVPSEHAADWLNEISQLTPAQDGTLLHMSACSGVVRLATVYQGIFSHSSGSVVVDILGGCPYDLPHNFLEAPRSVGKLLAVDYRQLIWGQSAMELIPFLERVVRRCQQEKERKYGPDAT